MDEKEINELWKRVTGQIEKRVCFCGKPTDNYDGFFCSEECHKQWSGDLNHPPIITKKLNNNIIKILASAFFVDIKYVKKEGE